MRTISPSPVRPLSSRPNTAARKPKPLVTPLSSPSKTETLLKSPSHSAHTRLSDMSIPKIPFPDYPTSPVPSRVAQYNSSATSTPQPKSPVLPAPTPTAPLSPSRSVNQKSEASPIARPTSPLVSTVLDAKSVTLSPKKLPLQSSQQAKEPPSSYQHLFRESDNDNSFTALSKLVRNKPSAEIEILNDSEMEIDTQPEKQKHRDSIKVPLNDTAESKATKASQAVEDDDDDSSSETTFKFAKLPVREPYTKKSFGKTPSRDRSWIDYKSGVSALASLSSHNTPGPALPVAKTPVADSITTTTVTTTTTTTFIPATLGPVPLYPDAMDTDDMRLSLPPAANSSLRMSDESMAHPSILDSKAILDMDIDMPDLDDSISEPRAPSAGPTVAPVSKPASPKKPYILNDFGGAETKTLPATRSAAPSPIRGASKGSVFRFGKNVEPTTGIDSSSNSSLFSATVGAFKRAKKLLFEHSNQTSPKVPLEQRLRNLEATEASKIPRSPSRASPTRSPFKSTLISPIRSVSNKLLQSPTAKRQASASRVFGQPASPTEKSRLATHSTAFKSQSTLATKSLYPELPKLASVSKAASTSTLLHFEPINRKPSPDLASVSMNATAGSPPRSPNRNPFDRSQTVKMKPSARLYKPAEKSDVSGFTKLGVAKQPLRRQNTTAATPSHKPMPVIPTPATVAMKEPKAVATTLPLKPRTNSIGAADSFTQKFKATLAAKPKEEPARVVVPVKPLVVAKKRTSDSAFGSPLDERKSLSKHQRMSNLGEPQRVPQQAAKKPSYAASTASSSSTGKGSSLMKNTVLQQTAKTPYADKLKFGATTPGSVYRTAATTPKYTVQPGSAQKAFAGNFSTPANQLSGYRPSQSSKMPPPPSTASKTAMAAAAAAAGSSSTQPKTVLPEIYSESEDDDEGSVLMEWANSPELHSMLLRQQSVDPDTVFGPIAPLKLEEVFKSVKNYKPTRLRPRSSSSSWLGRDKLSQQEIDEYARSMGYKK